jgi:coenzyme F420 hydrogenase subunit beta
MVEFRDATDVAAWRMCIGCGACVAACPDQKLRMVDVINDGLRPERTGGECSSCNDCVTVCPGIDLSQPAVAKGGYIESLFRSWGPVLQVWEGHAMDPDLRYSGSSGGMASALALYAVERAGMQGVVHVGHDDVVRYKNKTAFSTTRQDLLSATGSRYAPASPCDGLRSIERGEVPAAFVGKPCDVAGLRKTQAIRPKLESNVGVAIGIFCAGTPSTQGTLDLLAKHGIRQDEVAEVRYRGRGWPGRFAVRRHGSEEWIDLATYAEAWGFLQRYRPYRCHLCPDSTAEFADISCGDPWYRPIEEGELGSSLVLARTERGREIIEGAIKAGYVQLRVVSPQILDLSQRELQKKRGAIWGRVTTLKALGIPAPRLTGFNLFANWLQIPFVDKLRSVIGTARRAFSRRLYRPMETLRTSHRVAVPDHRDSQVQS